MLDSDELKKHSGFSSSSSGLISWFPRGPREIDAAEGFVHHGSHGSINLLNSPLAIALWNFLISPGDRSSNLSSSPEVLRRMKGHMKFTISIWYFVLTAEE